MSKKRVAAVSATVGTPYGSVAFDGSTQALSITQTSAFYFGTADFTIEFWWRPTVSRRSDVLDFYNEPGSNNTRLLFGASITGTSLELYVDHPGVAGGAKITGATTSSILNAWNHIALTRQSGSIKMWLNGTQTGSTYSATVFNFGQASSAMTLSIMKDHNANGNGSGNLTNIRVVAGTALYTATFTPPISPLQVVSGTQLLLSTTNDANFLKDYSSNNFTVTNTGTVVTASSTPFYTITTSATVSANVSIGTANGSPFVTSVNSYTIASQPASAPYNSISVPGNNGFAFGTGDYTIEWFQYVITSQTNQRAFWYGTSPSIGVSQEGFASAKTIYTWVATSPTSLGTANLSVSTWQHHAVVRISSKIYYYINGTILNAGGTTSTSNYTDTTSTFYFGSKANTGLQNEQFIGSMTNMRIVKGLGVYTGNFTKPTGPLTSVATANPYGGSNTAAITSGLTSLLLTP